MSGSWEPYVLAVGAVLGVLIRARYTSGQPTIGRETGQDCFIAAVLAMVWTVPFSIDLPALGTIAWPPFQFPDKMALPIRGALMALMASLFIGVLKKILLRFPEMFERITGTPAPKNGGGK